MTSLIADKTRAGLMGPGHVRRLDRLESAVNDPLIHTSVVPTLDLDFTSFDGAPFDDYFARSGAGGYRVNNKGVLVPTVDREPVIDFADGVEHGTAFYGAYTNIVLWSEAFDNVSWSKTNVTVTANAIAAPDGATTMDLLTTTAGTGVIAEPFSISSGDTTIRTLSVYLKPGTALITTIAIAYYFGGTTNYSFATITWATLSVVLAGTGNNKAYFLEDVGNGIYRLSVSGSNSGGSNTAINVELYPAGNGSATGTCYMWGAQLTATAFPAPYVPTTSVAVARAADVLTITGTDFTDFYNQTEGTFYVSGDVVGEPASLQDFLIFYDGSASNYIGLRQGAVLPGMDVVIYSGGPIQTDTNQANVRQGNSFSTALSMKKDQVIFVNDGLTVHSLGASRNMPVSVDRMRIAGLTGAGVRLKRLIYFPEALDAATLQRMTA